VHVQLREQIRFLILSGALPAGARLPPAHHLAGYLRINRHTVLRAYQELEREGLLECRRGRGCLVAEGATRIAELASTRLLEIIDRAMEEAGALGVSPGQFAVFAYARAGQRRERVGVQRRVVFVECASRIAAAFAQTIQERLDVQVVPLVLGDLQQGTAEARRLIEQAHVVATTFFHLQEVRGLLPKGKRLVALGLRPHLQGLMRVAEVARGTAVAVVCTSECSARNMKQLLEDAGIHGLDAVACGVDEPQRLRQALAGRAVVIASDLVADEVRPLLQPGQQLITLDYLVVDEAGLHLLRSVLEEGASA
jgi:GntR family transcriptional regulator